MTFIDTLPEALVALGLAIATLTWLFCLAVRDSRRGHGSVPTTTGRYPEQRKDWL